MALRAQGLYVQLLEPRFFFFNFNIIFLWEWLPATKKSRSKALIAAGSRSHKGTPDP
jgi:hypothetical protein